MKIKIKRNETKILEVEIPVYLNEIEASIVSMILFKIMHEALRNNLKIEISN